MSPANFLRDFFLKTFCIFELYAGNFFSTFIFYFS